MTYKTYDEYKKAKLASKQADNMYKTLIDMHKNGCSKDEFHLYYNKLKETHLYKKHGSLYCQVLCDVEWDIKK